MFENLSRILSGKSAEQAALEKKIMAQVKRDIAMDEALTDNLSNKTQAKKTLEDSINNAITAEEQGDLAAFNQSAEAIKDAKEADRRANANLIALNRTKQQASQNVADESTAKAIHIASTCTGSSMSVTDIAKQRTESLVGRSTSQAQTQQLQGMIGDLSSARIGSGGISTEEIRSLIDARKEVRQQSAEKKLDNILERLDGVDQANQRKQS